MLGSVKMEGHDHSDWSAYYAEPEVGMLLLFTFYLVSQFNIGLEIILTLRSNIDSRHL